MLGTLNLASLLSVSCLMGLALPMWANNSAVSAQSGCRQRALALFNAGCYTAAVEQFEALGFIAPLKDDELMLLADVCLASGDAHKAIIVYRQVLQHNQAHVLANNALSKAYAVVACQ